MADLITATALSLDASELRALTGWPDPVIEEFLSLQNSLMSAVNNINIAITNINQEMAAFAHLMASEAACCRDVKRLISSMRQEDAALQSQISWLRARMDIVVPVPPVVATTWNPADMAAGMTLANGDLDVTRASGSGWGSLRGTQSRSAGDLYFTVTVVAVSSNVVMLGIADASASLAKHVGQDAASVKSCGLWSGGQLWSRMTNTLGGTAATGYGAGAVIGIRVTFSTFTVRFYNDATGALLGTITDATPWSLPFFPAASLFPGAGSLSNLNCGGPFTNLPAGASPWDP